MSMPKFSVAAATILAITSGVMATNGFMRPSPNPTLDWMRAAYVMICAVNLNVLALLSSKREDR